MWSGAVTFTADVDRAIDGRDARSHERERDQEGRIDRAHQGSRLSGVPCRDPSTLAARLQATQRLFVALIHVYRLERF
jgi:hypothetical protein